MPVSGIDASYYLTKDLDAATKFYSDLLGAAPTMHAPGFVSEWTFSGGETFGIYQQLEDFHISGTVMFHVDDVAAFVKDAMAKGVAFSGDGHIEDTPVCHMAFGQDPEGNRFIIHRPK